MLGKSQHNARLNGRANSEGVEMRRIRPVVRTGVVSFMLAMAIGSRSTAQQPGPGIPAEQFFENIKVLNGTPADQLFLSMHLMVGQLGEDCTYCHVDHNPANFPRDDKPAKQVARRMITMVNDLNKTTFGGKQVVTCYTCHQGKAKPVNMLRLPMTTVISEEAPKAPVLPSVDQLLAKYTAALGGDAAIRKVTSRVITATQDIPSGPGGKKPLPTTLKRTLKAPNLMATTYASATGSQSEGFDGQVAWSRAINGTVANMAVVDMQRLKRASELMGAVTLTQQFTKMEVRGREKVRGRDAYVVVGYPQDDSPETLYFDAVTGLMVRRATSLPTPVGDSPFQMDFLDYRLTPSGTRIPFVVEMTPGNARSEPQTRSTLRIQTVKDNLPVDSAVFAKPTATAKSSKR